MQGVDWLSLSTVNRTTHRKLVSVSEKSPNLRAIRERGQPEQRVFIIWHLFDISFQPEPLSYSK
jgi:hypothetical protein